MNLVSIDPFVEMEKMFNNLPSVRNVGNMKRAFVPALDVYEDRTNVVVEAPLAGINIKNVDVSVQKNVLTIQGEGKKEHEVDDKNYYHKEVRSGSFYRQVVLPVSVKEDKISAEFKDGVLKIICPKTVNTKAKKINVKITKKSKK